jgi:Zn-dependent protease with chaperone function
MPIGGQPVEGFAWWDVRDRAWRRARALFTLAAAVVAIYVAGGLAVLVGLLVAAGVGPWSSLDAWAQDVGSLGLAIAALFLAACAGLAIACIVWRGMSRTMVRYSRARSPEPWEVLNVNEDVAALALAYGMSPPRIWLIDDPAPNALAFGRPRAGNVCLTTGALGLARDELEALCMFHVSALASRVFAYATSAADLVMLGELCTRLAWAAAGLVLLGSILGYSIEVVAAFVLGVGVMVLVTRPVLFLADRGLARLLDDSAELVDLETTRHTALPASLARLLLTLLEDERRATSRWEVAHLWFERDVVDFVQDRRVHARFEERPFSDWLTPPFAGRCTRSSRRGLLERAQTSINLANGDARLRARLEHAKAISPRASQI